MEVFQDRSSATIVEGLFKAQRMPNKTQGWICRQKFLIRQMNGIRGLYQTKIKYKDNFYLRWYSKTTDLLHIIKIKFFTLMKSSENNSNHVRQRYNVSGRLCRTNFARSHQKSKCAFLAQKFNSQLKFFQIYPNMIEA